MRLPLRSHVLLPEGLRTAQKSTLQSSAGLGMPKLVHLPWKSRSEAGEAALEGRASPAVNSYIPQWKQISPLSLKAGERGWRGRQNWAQPRVGSLCPESQEHSWVHIHAGKWIYWQQLSFSYEVWGFGFFSVYRASPASHMLAWVLGGQSSVSFPPHRLPRGDRNVLQHLWPGRELWHKENRD